MNDDRILDSLLAIESAVVRIAQILEKELLDRKEIQIANPQQQLEAMRAMSRAGMEVISIQEDKSI